MRTCLSWNFTFDKRKNKLEKVLMSVLFPWSIRKISQTSCVKIISHLNIKYPNLSIYSHITVDYFTYITYAIEERLMWILYYASSMMQFIQKIHILMGMFIFLLAHMFIIAMLLLWWENTSYLIDYR